MADAAGNERPKDWPGRLRMQWGSGPTTEKGQLDTQGQREKPSSTDSNTTVAPPQFVTPFHRLLVSLREVHVFAASVVRTWPVCSVTATRAARGIESIAAAADSEQLQTAGNYERKNL